MQFIPIFIHNYVSEFTVEAYCFAEGRCLFKQPGILAVSVTTYYWYPNYFVIIGVRGSSVSGRQVFDIRLLALYAPVSSSLAPFCWWHY